MDLVKSTRKEELYALLDERNRRPNDREKIDRLIIQKFERKMAVVITDSVGFSKKTLEHGIIQYLMVLKKVNEKIKSIVTKNQGTLISEWADNFVLAFHSSTHAVKAAIEINHYLQEYNKNVPEGEKFDICIGIGYGPVLYVGSDIFGHEVNCASKLGEDLAERGEILITESTCIALKDKSDFVIEEGDKVEIGGFSLKYFKVVY